MKRIVLVLMLLTTLFGGTLALQAQIGEPPLFMIANNRLWLWTETDAAPQPVGDRTHVQDMTLSPDGSRLAYMGFADITIDAIERVGGIGGGALPSDIWLLDIASGQSTPIAQQPPDASFFTDGQPDNAIMRSAPVWSPDGTRLAWTEQTTPASDPTGTGDLNDRVVVYDLATATSTTVISDLPPQAGVPVPMELTWGTSGLLLRSVTMDETGTFAEQFLLYDPQGNLRASFAAGTPDRLMTAYQWVTDAGTEYLAVQYADSAWELIDPLTGAAQPMNGVPEQYSALAPDTSLGLMFVTNPDGSHHWALSADPTQTFTAAGFFPQRTTLSASGQIIAFSTYFPEQGVYGQNVSLLSFDGRGMNIPDPEPSPFLQEIAWGPIAWRVSRTVQQPPVEVTPEAAQPTAEVTPVVPQPTAEVTPIVEQPPTEGTPVVEQPAPVASPTAAVTGCPGSLPPRLVIGGQGRVRGVIPNNVRDQPGLAGAQLGIIPGSETFTVLAGPQCADDLTWWQVDYNGLIGWTAEGQGDSYWLQPVQ